MEIPQNTKIYEFPTSTVWFDENGIVCSVAKKVPPLTVPQTREVLIRFRELTGGKKICLVSDSTHSAPVNKEMRDYLAEVMPEIVLAVAIISRSPVGKMAANLSFSIKRQLYPVRMFNDEMEAKAWLQQFL